MTGFSTTPIGKSRSATVIECLESRIAPAAITVINLSDHGPGSLRQALLDANDQATHLGADTINFKTGLHGNIKLTSGLLSITDDVTIDGGGKITIDGKTKSQLFDISSATGINVALSGLKLTHGVAPGDAANGGAIVIDDAGGNVSLEKCLVTGNMAIGLLVKTYIDPDTNKHSLVTYTYDAKGGAIDNENANLTITNSIISKNAAIAGSGKSASGGGIFNGADATLTLQSSIVTGNAALGLNGAKGSNGAKGANGYRGAPGADGDDGTDGDVGGIGEDGGSALGGGIFNQGTVTVQKSTISGNAAVGGSGSNGGAGGKGGNGGAGGHGYTYQGYHTPAGHAGAGGSGGAGGDGGHGGNGTGGAIYSGKATLTVQDSTISGNTAAAGGAGKHGVGGKRGSGGTYATNGDAGNDGESGDSHGGGIQSYAGVLSLTQCTIAKNTGGAGGGLNVDQNTSTAIHNSTIAANKSAEGGGLSVTLDASLDPVNVISTIIAANTAASDPNVHGTIVGDHNFLSGLPGLGKLKNNGGPTFTMLPSRTSAVLNLGTNPDALAFDQRGAPFARGATVDIGAVEV